MTKKDFREWIEESIAQAIERIETEEQAKWAGYVYVYDLLNRRCGY